MKNQVRVICYRCEVHLLILMKVVLRSHRVTAECSYFPGQDSSSPCNLQYLEILLFKEYILLIKQSNLNTGVL